MTQTSTFVGRQRLSKSGYTSDFSPIKKILVPLYCICECDLAGIKELKETGSSSTISLSLHAGFFASQDIVLQTMMAQYDSRRSRIARVK